MEETDELANLTARDIAGLYSLGADRVMMSRVDDSTVVAMGFAMGFASSTQATGRVAWMSRILGVWRGQAATRTDEPTHGIRLNTQGDLDALVAWLRGDA